MSAIIEAKTTSDAIAEQLKIQYQQLSLTTVV